MKAMLKHFHFISFLFLYLFFHSPYTFAQDYNWVTIEGMAPMGNVTPEVAKKNAINNARLKAIEQVAGVNILSEMLVVNLRLSSHIIKSIPYGKVVEEKILNEATDSIYQKGGTTPSLVYKVKMRMKVAIDKGKPDPYFKIDASLSRHVLQDGDEIQINLKTTKDSYITIFNITEDDKVLILVPNKYKENTFIKAGQGFSYPGEIEKEYDITLNVHLPEGKTVAKEAIYILALKQPYNFDHSKFKEGIYGYYDKNTAFINDLFKEIVGIPLKERVEKFLLYEIRNR